MNSCFVITDENHNEPNVVTSYHACRRVWTCHMQLIFQFLRKLFIARERAYSDPQFGISFNVWCNSERIFNAPMLPYYCCRRGEAAATSPHIWVFLCFSQSFQDVINAALSLCFPIVPALSFLLFSKLVKYVVISDKKLHAICPGGNLPVEVSPSLLFEGCFQSLTKGGIFHSPAGWAFG